MRFQSKCKDLWISDFCCRQKIMETTSCDFDTNQIGYPWFSLYLHPTTTTSKINNDNWIIKNLISIKPFFKMLILFLFPKMVTPSLLPLYPVLILASMDILILTPSFSLKMNVCNIFPFFSIFKQLFSIQQQIDVRDHKSKKENRLFINFTKQTVAST